MEKFRWCFIGTGKLANKVAEQIRASGRHEITAVYSRRPESAQAFAAAWGGRAYAEARAAVCADDVDGVYIVTPHTSHAEYARLALECGRPVLVEKPLTVRGEETDALIALARQKQVYLAEAMWTWFSPVAQQALRWLQQGELGTVRSAVLTYHRHSSNYAPRVTDPQRAGGALLDVAIYPVTYLYRLFGMPQKIVCSGTLAGGIDLGEDIRLTFADGLCALASVSIVDNKGFEMLKIRGSRGELRGPEYHCADHIELRRGLWHREVFRGDGSYANEFDCVAAEIRAGLTESRLVPLQATADVMHILDECRRQLGLLYPFETKLP